MATLPKRYLVRYIGSNGVAKALEAGEGITCDLRPTPLSLSQIAQLIDEPDSLPGYKPKQIISCSNTGETYADAVNSGYTDIVDPDPDPQPPQDSGQTVIGAVGNSDILKPVVQEQNGKYRIVNTATYDTNGKPTWHFEDGQVGVKNLSTAYRYLPGDDVSLLLAVADSPDPYVSYFDRNAQAEIKFGNAQS